MELECSVQNYHWGKKGRASIVAEMVKSANPGFVPREDESYAELWMGTHPNGPSICKGDNVTLEEYIAGNKHVLGSYDDDEKSGGLPFLFKLLSIGKALSIQVHPDKETAKELHKQQPDVYKDPNHKPELAIALDEFEAFCGFRSEVELKYYIEMVPELEAVVGDWSRYFTEDPKSLVKNCFQTMLDRESEMITEQLARFVERLSIESDEYRERVNASLVERLYKDFPGDVGCFGYFFFNHLKLQPGEAIYIKANEPHAYLFGECIECMACSDNVVRAGLTPKAKDIPTLVHLLRANEWEALSAKKLQPVREDDCTEVFRPPVRDFAVARVTVPLERGSYNLIRRPSASILLVINGKAEFSNSKILNRGSVLFVAANESTNIKLLDREITMFQAFGNF